MENDLKSLILRNMDVAEYSEKIDCGIQIKVFFENGYGASIIRTHLSYGYKNGNYEIAVIKGNLEEYQIDYKTGITDDVLGNIKAEDICKILLKISKLEK